MFGFLKFWRLESTTRLLLGLLVLLVLPGCAKVQQDFATLRDNITALTQKAGSVNVSPKAVYIARNAWLVVERSATNYLLLPNCPTTTVVCADPTAVARIVPFVRSGNTARNALVAYMKAHPDGTGAGSLYDELTSADAALRQILVEYNVIKAG